MSVFLSTTNKAINQRPSSEAQINKSFLNTILFVVPLLAILTTISLEINGHSLSFYHWDWIQVPFWLNIFFISGAILVTIRKSKSSNAVMVPQFVPSISDPSKIIALPLSKELIERNLIEQDLNAYSSTIATFSTEFMGPLIVKRLERSFYITQIKDFAIAEKERCSPYLVSFKPTSSCPFEEVGLVFQENEWYKKKNHSNWEFPLHRQYEYQILHSHISVFISLSGNDLANFEITMKDRPGVPLTTLSRLGIEFLDHRFTPPKEYTLIDAVTRGVKAIHMSHRTIFDINLFCITEISASDKSEELIDVTAGYCNFFPITKVPLSLEDAQEKLKNFALEYYDFNPKHIAFVPHLSIIACFNLDSTYDHRPEFYIAKPNHGFEKKFIHRNSGRGGFYELSSILEARFSDTIVSIELHYGEIFIHGFKATQITNYSKIVPAAFRQLRERINVIEAITIDALKDLIFLYLNPT